MLNFVANIQLYFFENNDAADGNKNAMFLSCSHFLCCIIPELLQTGPMLRKIMYLIEFHGRDQSIRQKMTMIN